MKWSPSQWGSHIKGSQSRGVPYEVESQSMGVPFQVKSQLKGVPYQALSRAGSQSRESQSRWSQCFHSIQPNHTLCLYIITTQISHTFLASHIPIHAHTCCQCGYRPSIIDYQSSAISIPAAMKFAISWAGNIARNQ